MKKTPKILPTYYKSKGTPIFRDTTALPFAIGGPLEDEPRKPGSPPSWNRPQLSEEKIEALKELHGDSIFASANPNDLLFYDLNKDAIEQAEDFSKFLDPSAKVNPRFTDAIMTKDIKTRLSKQGYALDTKTGNYFKIPDEVYKQIVVKEDPLTKLATLEPAKVDRALLELQQRPMPVLPEYTKPPYHIDMPTITMAHHHSGQLIPHARPQIHSARVPGLIPSIVQKLTGYDKAFMEGTYDAEGNYIPGEIENAQQQNRPINFVGANSLRDLKAQKEYKKDIANSYADGGSLECPPGYVNVNGTCVPVTPTERGPVEQDSAAFLTKMANSPLFAERYNAMIGDTAKPEEIEAYRQSVLNNINNTAFWPLGKEADNSNWTPNADYIGYYSGVGNADTDKFGLSQLPQDLNNPNRYDLGNQEHVIFRNFASPTTTTHEFSHASTLGDRIPATVKIPFSKDPAKKEYVKWFSQDDFSNQTENKAYLDETRKYLYDKGIYDPTTKAFDEQDYDNLIKTRDDLKLQLQQDPNNPELKMLMDSFNKNTLPYDKPATIKLFNSYVQNTPEQNQGTNNLALGLSNQMADGGPIYTYDKRPGSYYQRAQDGSWMISNAGTNNQYVPIDDPTGKRTELLNKNAVVYNAPAQGAPKPTPLRSTNTAPQVNQKIYPGNPANFSETTQAVAAKTTPQTAEERANIEAARRDISQRKANLEKVLLTQGKTPEQAASIVGSYGSDWPTLEAENTRALDTMLRRTEAIQSGNSPDKMSAYTPRPAQSNLGFAKDVLFNPFTAAGYAVRGQEIPDYMGEKIDNGTLGYYSNGQFVQGRNLLDTAVDAATPVGWAHSGYNIGEKALNNKSGDFFTEENAWDALNVLPGISLAAKGMKYAPLTSRINFAPKSTATNLAVDAGNIAREPFYAPQRPSFLTPSISQRETEFYNPLPNPEIPQINPQTGLMQINNTTMLSSPLPGGFVRSESGEFKSIKGLPEYMYPYLYSQEIMNQRISPELQAYYQMQKVQKAADKVVKRTIDDKVYYDLDGNIIKTPADNY